MKTILVDAIMKKTIFTALLVGISISYGCSQIENFDTNGIKGLDDKEKLVFTSQEEVLIFLESVDNSNPIFIAENLLRQDNEKFKVQSESNVDVKLFLQNLNLIELNELESLGGNKKFNQKHCNIITAEAKKYFDFADIENSACDYNLNAEKTYENVDPLLISLFQFNENYIFLTIAGEGLGAMNFFNVIYNIKTEETIHLTKDTKFANNMYYSENKIWFLNFSKILSYYDLNLKKFTDLSGNFYNKSYKWVTTQTEPNLIVNSFDNTKTVNLGNLNRNGKNKNMDHLKFETYFETDESNSYFASLDDVSCKEDYYNCLATIRYGKLEENGLQNSKTYEVKYEPFETMCFESANSAIFLKDNLIITRSGCPSILELTIFDIEKEKFLFRNENVIKGL